MKETLLGVAVDIVSFPSSLLLLVPVANSSQIYTCLIPFGPFCLRDVMFPPGVDDGQLSRAQSFAMADAIS